MRCIAKQPSRQFRWQGLASHLDSQMKRKSKGDTMSSCDTSWTPIVAIWSPCRRCCWMNREVRFGGNVVCECLDNALPYDSSGAKRKQSAMTALSSWGFDHLLNRLVRPVGFVVSGFCDSSTPLIHCLLLESFLPLLPAVSPGSLSPRSDHVCSRYCTILARRRLVNTRNPPPPSQPS